MGIECGQTFLNCIVEMVERFTCFGLFRLRSDCIKFADPTLGLRQFLQLSGYLCIFALQRLDLPVDTAIFFEPYYYLEFPNS